MSEPRIDPERMLEDARALAYPRFPGSAGDRRAIEWLASRMEELGLEVELQWFSYDMRPAWAALRTLLAGAAILLAAAGWLASSRPPAALVLAGVALVGGAVFLAWAPGLENLYRRPGATRTANVIGRARSTGGVGPRGETGDEKPAALILLAHHDSKSQNLRLPARAALTATALAGATGLSAVLVAAALGHRLDPRLATLCGLAAAVALLLLSTLKSGNESPGGVDNAGSVAILLELARHLPRLLPAGVELIFLSPGAEEDHMVGAMRWLDRNRDDLADRRVSALNFDGAGIPGRIALLERFGFGRRFSPRLSRVARLAGTRLGIPLRGVFLPPAMGVDAIPFAHRGFECLTIASGSLGRATFAVHSADDVAENLDLQALEQAARLGLEMARILASQTDPMRDPP